MKWGVTKVKHPNKGHTPNKGQKPMYQNVRYSESPLYFCFITLRLHGLLLLTMIIIYIVGKGISTSVQYVTLYAQGIARITCITLRERGISHWHGRRGARVRYSPRIRTHSTVRARNSPLKGSTGKVFPGSGYTFPGTYLRIVHTTGKEFPIGTDEGVHR